MCINPDLFTEIKKKSHYHPPKSGQLFADTIFKFLSINRKEWITTQNILSCILLCILYTISSWVYGLA